jgi:hypothetical protein
MATAAETGLATAVRGAMRLCLTRMASIASGIPWPRIRGAHRASRLMSRAPTTAAMTMCGPMASSVNEGVSHAHRWNRARLVTRPMRWRRVQAARPPPTPRTAARQVRTRSRRGEVFGADIARNHIVRRYDLTTP